MYIIIQAQLLKEFWSNADAIGVDKLSIHSKDIGIYSNRSAVAMAMFLANTPIFFIMLVGRWYSHTFLKHIRY